MKRISAFNLVYLLFVFSSYSHSQMFDESFLSSLPEDLQGDFLDQAIGATDESDKYSNPDTRIKTLEAELRSA